MAPETLPQRPFTFAELPALGLSESQLRGLLATGAVRRVVRGCYLVATVPDTLASRAAAVAAVAAEGHVVVDRTAAWLHGVDVLLGAEKEAIPPVEACVLRDRNPSHRRGTDARTRSLSVDDVMTIHGAQVTTPVRTALDLGCNLRRREAYAALNEFARRHRVTPELLVGQLPRFRRRRGVRQLRELIGLIDARLESPRESWTLLALYDAGLPLPEPQFWVRVNGIDTFRLDFAYPLARVCVEYDGIDAHEKTAEQREYDEGRRRWLRDHGWVVIVVRRGDFSGESLDRWLAAVRDALRPSYSNRRW